jgi:hypothetical protein
MSEAQLKPWRVLRQMTLRMESAGAVVVDATSLLGRREGEEFDGTYIPRMSDDGAHPNDVGHSTIAETLVSIFQEACR